MAKTGVLLINLGTPSSAQPSAVYRYLKQFLNDPRVIDLPLLVRYLLVNVLIIPTRYKKSAHAYQQIWTEQGSPLLVYTEALKNAVAAKLGDDFQLEIGMRYGEPSIASAVAKLHSCTKIVAIPLFPQYSSAANGSAMEELFRVLGAQWNVPEVHVVRDFYNYPAFIKAFAAIIKENLANKKIDQIIFSYHGLPERHIHKSLCRAACDKAQACPAMSADNAYCYRAQSFETTRLLVNELELSADSYCTTFQSRLGRTPWIKPYTDIEIEALAKQQCRNIAVVCPSFVSDCLETLEEINIRAREQWLDAGGESFTFIPCINAHPVWADGLAEMVKLF